MFKNFGTSSGGKKGCIHSGMNYLQFHIIGFLYALIDLIQPAICLLGLKLST